jgi:ribosome biogenesis GTPase / thiamine phosphate phosphatase
MYNHETLIKQYDNLALITELHGNRGLLWNDAIGSIPFITKKQHQGLVVGDFVNYQPLDDNSVVIDNIKQPFNKMERLNKRGIKQSIVNNLTQIILVVSPEPKPNYLLIDKFILISELMKCQLTIVLNKIDLSVTKIEHELNLYTDLGYELIKISAKTKTNKINLIRKLQDHRSVLVGQSGVGKSTITNLLLSSDKIKTRSLSTKSKKGKHTTTATKIHLLNTNTFLTDTPGIENLHPSIHLINDIQKGFVEIYQDNFKCKYRDCSHLNEPSCQVKENVSLKKISEQRYENYKKLVSTYL